MADIVTEYIQANDNANEYSNKLLKEIQPQALEDIDDLIISDENRDVELWDEFEVDPGLVSADYDDTEVEDRDLDWVIGLAGLSAAASVQFFLDNREDLIINPSAYRLQKMDRFSMTREQLVRAGKREVLTVPLETYERLQANFVAEFSSLKNVGNKELYNILTETKALRPIEKHVADSMSYVSRMTNYPKGSPQFKGAVADLVNTETKQGLMGMNRRSVDMLNTVQKSGGDIKTLMVWILDPSSKHCQYCPEWAGEVRTLEEWESDGLPGAEVCAGGDKCNCHLDSISA